MVSRKDGAGPFSRWGYVAGYLLAGIACMVVGWIAVQRADADQKVFNDTVGKIREANLRISTTSSKFEEKLAPAEAKAMVAHLKMANDALDALDRPVPKRSVLDYFVLAPQAIFFPWMMLGFVLFAIGWGCLKELTVYRPEPRK
jgi:hypothetical protein